MSEGIPTRPENRIRLRHFPCLVLAVAAAGLWLVPGDPGQPALTLMKLGVSLGLLVAAIGLHAKGHHRACAQEHTGSVSFR